MRYDEIRSAISAARMMVSPYCVEQLDDTDFVAVVSTNILRLPEDFVSLPAEEAFPFQWTQSGVSNIPNRNFIPNLPWVGTPHQNLCNHIINCSLICKAVLFRAGIENDLCLEEVCFENVYRVCREAGLEGYIIAYLSGVPFCDLLA